MRSFKGFDDEWNSRILSLWLHNISPIGKDLYRNERRDRLQYFYLLQ